MSNATTPTRPSRFVLAAAVLTAAVLTPSSGQLEALPPPPSVQTRVMTWNVGTINPFDFRLPTRFEDRVANGIVGAGAEVVCLQEVRDDAQARRLRDLIVAKGGPVYSIATAVMDPRRSDGRTSAFLYTGNAHHAPVWQSSSGYRAQALILDDVTVVNVHGPAGNYRKRRTYYPELVAWVRTLPQPVVVAGDFNLGSRGGAGMAAFLPWLRRHDKRIYRDLTAAFAAHTDVGATTLYGLIFDHVMISDGQILTQERLDGRRRFPMDHRPVLTELLTPVPTTRAAAIATFVAPPLPATTGTP